MTPFDLTFFTALLQYQSNSKELNTSTCTLGVCCTLFRIVEPSRHFRAFGLLFMKAFYRQYAHKITQEDSFRNGPLYIDKKVSIRPQMSPRDLQKADKAQRIDRVTLEEI